MLLDELPIPRFFEHERGPYITAGAIVAKDRAQRADQPFDRAADAARRQPRVRRHRAESSSCRAGARRARARRDARYCGLHRQPPGRAGRLLSLSRPRRRRTESRRRAACANRSTSSRCVGSDLLVPAHCECVLEGTLDAGEPVEEGPVSEFHGFYENYGPGIVATVQPLDAAA